MSGSWHARTLAAPSIVGSMMGAAALGQIALAQRIIETLSTARVSAARVAAAGIPQTLSDRARLRSIVERGSILVTLATGIPTALACCLVGWLPGVIPAGWEATAPALPGLATASILGGLSVMWSSVLVAEGRARLLTLMHCANAGLLLSAAALLVPRLGPAGFALADIIAAGAFAISWNACRSSIGNPLSPGAALAAGGCITIAWLPSLIGA
jgi:O-antigen/teichoic acid export membrane protein